MTTQSQLIQKHINQINKMAWSYSKTTGQDFDDLKSEGTLAMMKAIKAFDPEKGYQLSTLIHISANNAMNSYVRKQCHSPIVEEPNTDGIKSHYACPVKRFEFMDSLKSLGNEAKQMIQLIFAAPGEVLNIASDESLLKVLFEAPADIWEVIANESPCKARIMIKEYMKELGFTKEEIGKGIREIRSTFIN